MNGLDDIVKESVRECCSSFQKLDVLAENIRSEHKEDFVPETTDLNHEDTPMLNEKQEYKWDIKWINVIAFIYIHVTAVYAIYLGLCGYIKPITLLFGWFTGFLSGLGVTAGTHRLWTHRTYQANWQLRTILMIFQTMAAQNFILFWVRDHRTHHKYTDTDADPHNSRRGFFYSHIGWLMLRKHPEVKNKVDLVDMSDVEEDPIVQFQKRYYIPLLITFSLLIPLWIPWYFWGERLLYSWYNIIIRWFLVTNSTWLVNSAAHLWGNKPYDAEYSATENLPVAFLAVGEGWHNYHHAFPWDYKTAELGSFFLNPTTVFIDLCAKIGWATELKTASSTVIAQRAARSGDGTHASQLIAKCM